MASSQTCWCSDDYAVTFLSVDSCVFFVCVCLCVYVCVCVFVYGGLLLAYRVSRWLVRVCYHTREPLINWRRNFYALNTNGQLHIVPYTLTLPHIVPMLPWHSIFHGFHSWSTLAGTRTFIRTTQPNCATFAPRRGIYRTNCTHKCAVRTP